MAKGLSDEAEQELKDLGIYELYVKNRHKLKLYSRYYTEVKKAKHLIMVLNWKLTNEGFIFWHNIWRDLTR